MRCSDVRDSACFGSGLVLCPWGTLELFQGEEIWLKERSSAFGAVMALSTCKIFPVQLHFTHYPRGRKLNYSDNSARPLWDKIECQPNLWDRRQEENRAHLEYSKYCFKYFCAFAKWDSAGGARSKDSVAHFLMGNLFFPLILTPVDPIVACGLLWWVSWESETAGGWVLEWESLGNSWGLPWRAGE